MSQKYSILVGITAIVFSSIPISVYASVLPAPVYSWEFDEGEGKAVHDALKNTPATIPAFSGWAAGKSGRAVVFGGKTGEMIALPNDILSGSSGSLSLWFKMEHLQEHNVLFGVKSTNDEKVHLTLAIDSEGRPVVTYRGRNTTTPIRAEGAKVLNVGEWYNLVWTADASTYRLYINGEEVGVSGANSGRWVGDVDWSPRVFQLANIETPSYSGVFDGYLDMVHLYSNVLSYEEAKSIFAEENLTTPTDPVGSQPRITLTATPATVVYGGSSVLTWSSTDSLSCTASGTGFSGVVLSSGVRSVINLGADTTFGLNCVGRNGTSTATAAVRVLPPGEKVSVGVPDGTLVVTPVPVIKSVEVPPAPQVSVLTAQERSEKIAYIQKEILRITKLLGELIALMQKSPK